MKTAHLSTILVASIFSAYFPLALAELPTAPAGVEFNTGVANRAHADAVGQVELLMGSAALRDADGNYWKMEPGTPFKRGDVLRTGADTRLRLTLKSGDALHVGDASLLAVADNGRLNIWSGRVAVYTQPVESGRVPLRVETPDGLLESEGGKLGLNVANQTTEILAFNNWTAWKDTDRFEAGDASRDWRMLARWREAAGKMVELPAGQRYRGGDAGKATMIPAEEVRFTYATSPEIPALKGALQALQQGGQQAKPLFAQLQRAFPGNAQAAYHLGRIALDAEDNLEALRQWQLYSRLDPQGAEQLQIGPKLTLLIHQTLKDEIKRAIATEAAISNSPPEPGSIAVLPFINRGDAAQAVLSKGLTAMVISDLSKVPGVKVLERAKLQKLMEEMQLSESGLVDEKTALRAGRLLKAEKIMLGDYQLQTDKK